MTRGPLRSEETCKGTEEDSQATGSKQKQNSCSVFSHSLQVDVLCLLTRRRWCQCWTLHKLIQGCRCPWLRCPDWRQTCRTKSFLRTENIKWAWFWTRFSPVHPCTYIGKANGLLPFRVRQKLLVLLSFGFIVSTGQMRMNLWSQNSERRKWWRTNLHRRTWVSGSRFWTRIQQFPQAKIQGKKEKHEAVQLRSLLMGKNIKFNHFIWNEAKSGAATLGAVCETHWSSSNRLFTSTSASSPGSWLFPLEMRLISVWVASIAEAVREQFWLWGTEYLHRKKAEMVQIVPNLWEQGVNEIWLILFRKSKRVQKMFEGQCLFEGHFGGICLLFRLVLPFSPHIRRK